MKGLKLVSLLMILLFFVSTAGAKTLKLAMDADPVSLDPHVQLSGGMLQYSHMVFDPLVRWTQDMQFEPRLAEKWERLDENTVRFHLRKGVKFHSGNPFTAKDIVWTLERLKQSQDVLTRPESLKAFELTRKDVVRFLRYIAYIGEKNDPQFLFRPNLKDEADNMFVELAIASQSRWLITSNLKDFVSGELQFDNFELVTPANFIKIWKKYYE